MRRKEERRCMIYSKSRKVLRDQSAGLEFPGEDTDYIACPCILPRRFGRRLGKASGTERSPRRVQRDSENEYGRAGHFRYTALLEFLQPKALS